VESIGVGVLLHNRDARNAEPEGDGGGRSAGDARPVPVVIPVRCGMGSEVVHEAHGAGTRLRAKWW